MVFHTISNPVQAILGAIIMDVLVVVHPFHSNWYMYIVTILLVFVYVLHFLLIIIVLFFLCFMHGFCFAMPVNHLMSPFYFSFAPSTFCLFIQLLLFYFILFFFGFFPLNTNTMLEYTFILDIEYNFPKTNGIGTGLRETNSKKFVFGEYSRGK